MDPLAGRLVEQLQDDPEAPEVVGLEGEDADVIFDALSSETTRTVLSACYDGGRTRSELADELDTSIQNVSYHVEKLESAGLVEPTEIRYGENRQEVEVYEPSKEAILIAAGETGVVDRLKHTIERLFSPVAVLALIAAVGSVLARGVERVPFGFGASGDDGGGAGYEPTSAEDAASGADGEDGGRTDGSDGEDGARTDGGDGDDGATTDQTTETDDTTTDSADGDGTSADGDATTADGTVETSEEYSGEADVVTDPGADGGIDALLTEPWVFAGLGIFLLGLVVVVTADRFGVFTRRPRRKRTGRIALLFGREAVRASRFLGGAFVLFLGVFLLVDAAVAGNSTLVRTIGSLGTPVLVGAGFVAGVVHAYANDGLVVTALVAVAPLLGSLAYLVAVPFAADGLVGLGLALAMIVGALLALGLSVGLVAYAIGRGLNRVPT